MRMLLNRIASTKFGTFGVLMCKDEAPFAVTLERPWKNNEVSVSCIPADIYLCERIQSQRFGNTFEVTEVSGRSAILFHKGNINDDTHGCILIGEQFEIVKGVPGIVSSAKGFDEFLAVTKNFEKFILEIYETF